MSQYNIFYHIIRVFELEDTVSIFIHFSATVFKIHVDLRNVTSVTPKYYTPKSYL